MKHCQKLLSCLIITALCVSGMMLGGCKKLNAKKHNLSVATGAVVNSMMVTNPMGALFGKDEGTASKVGGVESYAALSGCPGVNLAIDFTPAPYLYKSAITITYDPALGCLVNGIAISGTISGEWMVSIDSLKLYLESELYVDNMSMEGLTSNGYIHQKLHIDPNGPFAQIDGTMETRHADGRIRSMEFDNLTAQIDLSNLPELVCTAMGGCETTEYTEPAILINGSASYMDEDNNTYLMDYDNVTQPLVCGFPTSGTVHLVSTNPDEAFDAVIDYSAGEGTCDTTVTVTIDGEATDIDVSVYVNKHQYRF